MPTDCRVRDACTLCGCACKKAQAIECIHYEPASNKQGCMWFVEGHKGCTFNEKLTKAWRANHDGSK